MHLVASGPLVAVWHAAQLCSKNECARERAGAGHALPGRCAQYARALATNMTPYDVKHAEQHYHERYGCEQVEP